MDNSFMYFLAKLREQYSLTQAEMAARLNVSTEQISSWERGETFPDRAAIKNISEAFNLSADSLPNTFPEESFMKITTGRTDDSLHMSQHDFLRWLSRCYPVVVTIIYLIFGFSFDFWHPGWIIFLTIPMFYSYYYTMRDKY